MLKLGIIAYNCTNVGHEPPVQGNKATRLAGAIRDVTASRHSRQQLGS